MKNFTDFNKQCIFNCYAIMKDCVSFEHFDDADYIYSALSKLEQNKLALPTALCLSITSFIQDTLLPIVEDPDFFSEAMTPEIGFYNEQGIFEISSDESCRKHFCILCKISDDLNNKVDSFAEQHMKPYLI